MGEAKHVAEENKYEKEDLKERLHDAIQARWSLEEALRAAGVDPDEVDAALLSEKMKASAGQQDVALKQMAAQLSKAEKVIAEMREAYAKTKEDAEQTVNARE